MSKKFKPVIPKNTKGMTFNSLEDMGKALGIKPEPAPEPPKRRCTVCGALLRHIPETNIWVCDGTKEDGEPCTRRIISNPRPMGKPDDNKFEVKSGDKFKDARPECPKKDKPKPDFKSGDKNKENRQPKSKKDRSKGKSFGRPAQTQATA